MALASQKDFFSGLMFTAVGASFALGAKSYEVGDAARMGPGYFPLMLGVILAILGVIVTVQSFTKGGPGGDKIGAFAWRPLGFVLGANLAFGALLVGLMANYTGFLAPKVALFSNIALMVAVLLWRPRGVYPVASR